MMGVLPDQAERDTIAEREALEAEEEAAAERERARLEQRKGLTRDIVAEQIAREDAAARAAAEVLLLWAPAKVACLSIEANG
jgi:microfibrillar-associated protein 1